MALPSIKVSVKNPLRNEQNISVVGAGRSGRAACKLLHALGFNLTLHEKDCSKLPEDFKKFLTENAINTIEGEHKAEDFSQCDVLIPSPGVAIASLTPFLGVQTTVMAETELAWLYCYEIPVLAITGTSGKTTTTALCGAMLKQAGNEVFVGGNIGIPLSEYVLDHMQNRIPKADVLVLELSSFQLQTCVEFRPYVALCLNISENHLDYHADMEEYIHAKMNIFTKQLEDDYALVGAELMNIVANLRLKSEVRSFDKKVRRFPKTKLIGQHNQNNAEAAWQACQIFGVTLEQAEKAVKNFVPMENRLEFVATVNGIDYINDSKCTTVDALKTAITAIAESQSPICLLMGGKFKGGDLPSLLPLMQDNVKHIALFGGSRAIFEEAFQGHFPLSYDEHLSEAMQRLTELGTPGDTILLAPATSSFDQYQSYEKRGEDFRNIVANIKKKAK